MTSFRPLNGVSPRARETARTPCTRQTPLNITHPPASSIRRFSFSCTRANPRNKHKERSQARHGSTPRTPVFRQLQGWSSKFDYTTKLCSCRCVDTRISQRRIVVTIDKFRLLNLFVMNIRLSTNRPVRPTEDKRHSHEWTPQREFGRSERKESVSRCSDGSLTKKFLISSSSLTVKRITYDSNK